MGKNLDLERLDSTEHHDNMEIHTYPETGKGGSKRESSPLYRTTRRKGEGIYGGKGCM